MKKNFYIIFILIIIGCKEPIVKSETNTIYVNPIADYNYLDYHTDNGKSSIDNILLLGDSRLYELDTSNINLHTINFAYGGTTTMGILNRLPFVDNIYGINTFTKIYILDGFNDANKYEKPAQEFLVEINTIISNIRMKSNTKIVVFTTTDETADKNSDKDAIIESLTLQYNSSLKSINLANVVVYDLFSDLSIGNYLNPVYATSDGIHYNTAGQQIIYNIINLNNL